LIVAERQKPDLHVSFAEDPRRSWDVPCTFRDPVSKRLELVRQGWGESQGAKLGSESKSEHTSNLVGPLGDGCRERSRDLAHPNLRDPRSRGHVRIYLVEEHDGHGLALQSGPSIPDAAPERFEEAQANICGRIHQESG